MGGVIADTSIWVEIERRRLTRADVDAATANEPVFVAPVVISELEYGLARAKTADHRKQRARALAEVKQLSCLKIDDETGEIHGRVCAERDSAGRPSKHRIQDLWIASLALQHGLRVVTKNPSDFEDVPGLTVITLPMNPGQAATP